MRLQSEDQILDESIRAKIIEEIKGTENQRRKLEHFKRSECFKDRTDKWVLDQLLKQLDYETVKEMSYCISNVSLVKKVVEKLARVYSAGVTRVVYDANGNEVEEASKSVELIADEIDANTAMKTANRYLKLHRNLALYVKPYKLFDQYRVKLEPLQPYLYDVIEHPEERTIPMVYILSDYKEPMLDYTTKDPAVIGRSQSTPLARPATDGKDQMIADDDKQPEEYVFWSRSYHLTCNSKGKIISEKTPERALNPIQAMPIVNFAIDQDGFFWAKGGQDLADGAILINSMITNIMFVGILQGYGQFWMRGKNLPRGVKVGPNKAIIMEYTEGEPVPEIGFVNASPQLSQLKELVEMYVALLLTTNNLSTSGVSSQLNGPSGVASGVALMLDKAESREDVQDQEELFRDKEPIIWDLISKWIKAYGDQMEEGLRALALPEGWKLTAKFNPIGTIYTEAEKLDNMKKRYDLGIASKIDLLMQDNPELSRDEATELFKKILEERMLGMMSHQNGGQDGVQQEEAQTEEEVVLEDTESEEDDLET